MFDLRVLRAFEVWVRGGEEMEKKLKSYLWMPLALLWILVVQPIWNLNVETIATSQGINDELNDAARGVDPSIFPAWFWEWVSFLTGDFLWGAVTVGSVYFTIDFVAWMQRRRSAAGKDEKKLYALSSIYSDAHILEKHLRAETGTTYSGRPRSGTTPIPVGVGSKVRSFFAQLDEFDVPVPVVSKEMTVKDALVILDFLAVAMPFIGKSQVAQLRAEARDFIARLI